MTHIFKFSEVFKANEILDFHELLKNLVWYHGIPGGFVTNSPQRHVNAFGDGSPINDEGIYEKTGWKSSYWTAKINQSQITLETPTQQIPLAMSKLIPRCRELFKQVYPDANISHHTFNIAVCNYYNDPDMNIAPHTDDNPWYPKESKVGPVFASFTIYPEGEPQQDCEYARFQIRQDGKWQDIKLPGDSVMIMPSNIEHRVKPCLKKFRDRFKPRINITLRSTFSTDTNPLMNAMATCNHTRYYKPPSKIKYPSDIDQQVLQDIISIYNRFLDNYQLPHLEIQELQNKSVCLKKKQDLIKNYRLLGYDKFRVSNNMVYQLIEMVINYINDL